MKYIYHQLFCCCILLLGLLACSKQFRDLDQANAWQGDGYIRGRVFLTDTLTQQLVGRPLAKATVQIRLATDSANPDFLKTAISDDNGYFLITGLSNDQLFELQCDYTVNGAKFADSIQLKATSNATMLELSFQPAQQSGIAITVTDVSGQGSLKGATVCLFSTPSLFNTNNCNGNNYTATTNDVGKANFLNIPRGTYYALTQLAVDNRTFLKKDTIVVGGATVFRYYRLSPQVPSTLNYQVVDVNGRPIKDANVCLFTSSVLYARDTCEGANYSALSNAEGRLSFSNLPVGRYFVYASLLLDSNKVGFVARDTFDLPGATNPRQLMLRRKF